MNILLIEEKEVAEEEVEDEGGSDSKYTSN